MTHARAGVQAAGGGVVDFARRKQRIVATAAAGEQHASIGQRDCAVAAARLEQAWARCRLAADRIEEFETLENAAVAGTAGNHQRAVELRRRRVPGAGREQAHFADLTGRHSDGRGQREEDDDNGRKADRAETTTDDIKTFPAGELGLKNVHVSRSDLHI
jgi:hypothetical protein